MTPTPNRRDRRAAKATAPVAPAVEASAERAATERDPVDGVDPVVVDPALTPAVDLPATDTAVLPEPTLVARPDEPMPIVTASPILAVEPSAIDVVQADAAADRVAAGLEPVPGPDGPHAAAAGQPMLTIEGDAVRAALWDAVADGVVNDVNYAAGDVLTFPNETDESVDWEGLLRELTEFRDSDPAGFAHLQAELHETRVLTLDDIVRGLEHLAQSDPIGMDIIGTRFFGDAFQGDRKPLVERPAVGSTVTVIEIVGPPQGRRRAGRSFGPVSQRFLASEFTDDEIVALGADPLLAVGVTEIPAGAFGPSAVNG